jgi:hypothetical protein
MYDLLLFPGQLSSKQHHSLLHPLMTSNTFQYLTESNFLSEFDTEEERDKVRKNLGLDDFVQEHELEDFVENKIIEEVKDIHSWIDV